MPRSESFSLRLPQPLYDRLFDVIAATGNEVTRSGVIVKALETYLAPRMQPRHAGRIRQRAGQVCNTKGRDVIHDGYLYDTSHPLFFRSCRAAVPGEGHLGAACGAGPGAGRAGGGRGGHGHLGPGPPAGGGEP